MCSERIRLGVPLDTPVRRRRGADFYSTVEEQDNGCWLWTGARLVSGYGITRNGEGSRLAHRVSWEFANGPVPEGLIVRHTCDNPPCVRPDHLLIGTYKDNTNDKIERGRSNTGERNRSAKLTTSDVLQIRSLAAPVKVKDIAVKYNVTDTTIRDILQRRTWTHL